MFTPEALEEHGTLRFTRLGELIGGVGRRMPTRRVFPVASPSAESTLTDLGARLSAGGCYGIKRNPYIEWAETQQQTTL